MAFASLACPQCWQSMAFAIPGSGNGSRKQALGGAGGPAGQLGTHGIRLFSELDHRQSWRWARDFWVPGSYKLG